MTDAGAAVGVPTLSDAERAAEALISEGATKVFLFGSVARGDAGPDSDIDLLVVMDDMGDYSQRTDIAEQMMNSLRGSTTEPTYPCDLLLTDRPELEHMISEVETSLYSAVAAYGKVLADIGPQGNIDWEKELVVSMNRVEEAETSLEEAIQQLEILSNISSAPWKSETQAWESGDMETYDKKRKTRLAQILGCGHLCFEMSLSALVHLLTDTPPARTHTTSTLAERLPDGVKQDITAIMGSLTHRDIQVWHVRRNYMRTKVPKNAPHPSVDMAVEIAKVACATLAYSANVLEEHGGNLEITEEARHLAQTEAEMMDAKDVGEYLSDVSSKRKSSVSQRRGFWVRLFSRRSRSKKSAPATEQNEFLVEVDPPSHQSSDCNRWMPNAKAHCVLRRGHAGNCRSK